MGFNLYTLEEIERLPNGKKRRFHRATGMYRVVEANGHHAPLYVETAPIIVRTLQSVGGSRDKRRNRP